jgi:DNA-binding NtrC family response regulator/pSer/pThr/pTyr-binding forkhead associated (FHA) protein
MRAKPEIADGARDAVANRLLLLVTSPERTFPFELAPGTEVIVGRGPVADLKINDAKVAPRHLALRAAPTGLLEVEDLNGGFRTLLNDVQLSGASRVRAGDQISLGGSALLVLRAPTLPRWRVKLLSSADFDELLATESERARRLHRPFSLLLLRSRAFGGALGDELLARLTAQAEPYCTWAELGSQERALLCPDVSIPEFTELRGTIASALGGEGHRFAIGYASYPEDGADADALLESALARLCGREPAASRRDEPLVLDPVMVRLMSVVERLAHSETPVLLRGEQGAGKETLARVLHLRSGRSAGPMINVSAAASGPGLEIELFGYEGGAFPGAEQAQAGALETAAGGSVLIRHLELLPLGLQSKLARALETRSATRLGSDVPFKLESRIIGSTVEDLSARIQGGTVREDLLARLGAHTLVVPPLRDRPSEIAALAELFLSRARKYYGRSRLTFGAEARAALARYDWPGNVRELKNAIERASMISATDEVHRSALPAAISREGSRGAGAGSIRSMDLRGSLRIAERDALLKTLAGTRWNVTQAAKRLGLPRRTVVYRMSRLGLRRPGR